MRWREFTEPSNRAGRKYLEKYQRQETAGRNQGVYLGSRPHVGLGGEAVGALEKELKTQEAERAGSPAGAGVCARSAHQRCQSA